MSDTDTDADVWVIVCRGGPTADCGRTDWHESHSEIVGPEPEPEADE